MNSERRSFLKKKVLLGCGLVLAGSIDTLAKASRSINTFGVNHKEVNIMFSSDLSGHLDPSLLQFGGLKNLHDTISGEDISSLLFDAGGFLGNDRSNLDHIKTIEWMNRVGYHAVNLSAVDLKKGTGALTALLPHISFALLSCNYHFEDQQIQSAVKPFQILKYGKFKIGVTGVGESVSIPGVTITDPVKSLNKVANLLKEEEGCDLIICLSHLGFDLNAKHSDNKLAELSNKVDLVVGGNSKIAKNALRIVKNSTKEEVLLGQTYTGAQSVSMVSFGFDASGKKLFLDLKQRVPGADKSLHVSESLTLIQKQHSQKNS